MATESTRNPQGNYTILRIKRKRNEEPLDALVIESARRKKSRGFGGGVNVFQFAETVEEDAWDDEKQKQDLETRISTLARSSVRKDGPTPSEPPKPEDTTTATDLPVKPPSAEPASTTSIEPSPRRHVRVEDPLRKYTIVPAQSPSSHPTNSTEWERRTTRRRPTAPPKVHSYKDLQKATFIMYDAVPSSSSLASLASPTAGAGGQTKADIDLEVAKFLPLLQDYLNISGSSPPGVTPSPSINTTLEGDEDYVWDVFYSRPASIKELYDGNAKVIGSVSGLPDDDGYGSSDDEDFDDEDDEDSNAEDWYKNDYPEEEDERSDDDDGSEGSDVFHEDSESDDVAHQRGRWDLGQDDD